MSADRGIVVDTPEAISLFTWMALRGAVRLEMVGMKRRGVPARKIACERLDLKPRTKIEDVMKAIEDKIASFPKPMDGVRTF